VRQSFKIPCGFGKVSAGRNPRTPPRFEPAPPEHGIAFGKTVNGDSFITDYTNLHLIRFLADGDEVKRALKLMNIT
jgi:hypothetical protein